MMNNHDPMQRQLLDEGVLPVSRPHPILMAKEMVAIPKLTGPYEVDTWWNDEREMLYIKFRRWYTDPENLHGTPKKVGIIFKLTKEALESMYMEVVEPGYEYPECVLVPAPGHGKEEE